MSAKDERYRLEPGEETEFTGGTLPDDGMWMVFHAVDGKRSTPLSRVVNPYWATYIARGALIGARRIFGKGDAGNTITIIVHRVTQDEHKHWEERPFGAP